MAEVWLDANRRPLWCGLAVALGLSVAGLALMTAGGWDGSAGWTTVVGWCLLLVAGPAATILARQIAVPRLVYADGTLRFYLRGTRPIAVPLDVVEGFLLGQGPAQVPGLLGRGAEASTLVVKLADRATEWERVEVNPRLARWCGHYITIRGAWTEPLSLTLVQRLNARLHEARQRARDEAEAEPAASEATAVAS